MKMMKSTTVGLIAKHALMRAHSHTTTVFEFVTTSAHSASILSWENARSEQSMKEEEKAIIKCVVS